MASIFVAIGEFLTRIIVLAIGIPAWFVMAFIIFFICTMVFGPIIGGFVAIVVILNGWRNG